MSEASWLIVGLINLHIDNGGLAVEAVEKQYNTIKTGNHGKNNLDSI